MLLVYIRGACDLFRRVAVYHLSPNQVLGEMWSSSYVGASETVGIAPTVAPV